MPIATLVLMPPNLKRLTSSAKGEWKNITLSYSGLWLGYQKERQYQLMPQDKRTPEQSGCVNELILCDLIY